MNDRFKFRAWYQPSWEEHRMLYNVEQTYDFMRGYPESVPADSFGEVLEDNIFLVMQCTGLKDKNGKLIYSGDIVSIDDGELKGIVQTHDKFDEFYGCVEIKLICKYPTIYKPTVLAESEVIGNIHENKELLYEC